MPGELLAVTDGGDVKRGFHKKWIDAQNKKEYDKRFRGSFSGVLIPKSMDVLLGKGKRLQEHIGNVRLRSLVDFCFDEYSNSEGNARKKIASDIVQFFRVENGGQFLKQVDGIWYEVSDDKARDRVSSAFKNRRHLSVGVLAESTS